MLFESMALRDIMIYFHAVMMITMMIFDRIAFSIHMIYLCQFGI